MRIYRADQLRWQPWKNGGGLTAVLGTDSGDAALDDFGWRASIAEVRQDGPFSRFDSVCRT